MHHRFTIISNDFHNGYMITGRRFQFRQNLGRIIVLIKDPIMQWSSFLTHEGNTDSSYVTKSLINVLFNQSLIYTNLVSIPRLEHKITDIS